MVELCGNYGIILTAPNHLPLRTHTAASLHWLLPGPWPQSALSSEQAVLPDIHIRVMGFLKDLFQLLQLRAGRSGTRCLTLLTAGYVAVRYPQVRPVLPSLDPFHGRLTETVTVVHGYDLALCEEAVLLP